MLNKLKNSKNPKIIALFEEIKPIEYLLSCFPFVVSMVSTKSISRSTFGFTMLAFLVMLGLGFLFFIGFRPRLFYYIFFLSLSLFLILYIGKPWQYWPMADRDSAIKVGIEAILTGENPYKQWTDLNNMPTPLPFTFLLYLPLYLITGGYVFYMNVIIMLLFNLVILYEFIDTEKKVFILPIIAFIIFSDFFFIEIGMNSDLINIGLLLCMLILLLPKDIPEMKPFLKYFHLIPEKPRNIEKKAIIFSILFGCLLAMRIHLWIIGAVVLIYLLKNYGIKNTLYLTIIIGSTFLLIILPFMLQDFWFFINVNPIAHNSLKFYTWRDYDTVDETGYIILNILVFLFRYEAFNGIIISILIILFSIILGLIKCENLFHLIIIISFCFLIMLFFLFFSPYFRILRDYVSTALVPFIFSIFFLDLEKKELKEKASSKYKEI